MSPAVRMSPPEVAELIVEALAQTTGVDADEVRAALAAAGEEWPCDSIVLAEVLVRVEAQLGVEVSMDASAARALRSVRGLAARLCAVIEGDRSE